MPGGRQVGAASYGFKFKRNFDIMLWIDGLCAHFSFLVDMFGK
jgi:hypothetical protein